MCDMHFKTENADETHPEKGFRNATAFATKAIGGSPEIPGRGVATGTTSATLQLVAPRPSAVSE